MKLNLTDEEREILKRDLRVSSAVLLTFGVISVFALIAYVLL